MLNLVLQTDDIGAFLSTKEGKDVKTTHLKHMTRALAPLVKKAVPQVAMQQTLILRDLLHRIEAQNL